MPHTRDANGLYRINGKTFKELSGSRVQVWNRTAHHTNGGLTRRQLMRNKWGRLVSAAKHRTAKKQKRLERAGFFAQKGKFGVVKKDKRKKGGDGEAVKIPE